MKEILYSLRISPPKLLITKGNKYNAIEKKPGKMHVNQVIKANINNGINQHHVLSDMSP